VRPSEHADGGRGDKGGNGGKGRSKSRVLSNILIAAGVVLLLVAAGMWGYAQWQYSQQDAENDKLSQYVTVSDDGSTAPVVDWAGLKAVNPEVCGWIQIPGTVISYPVYQHSDNEYYLRHTAEGDYSIGGQVFLDYKNTNPGMVDQQSIIYGHHLKNGAMFKQVADMDQQGFFDTIKTVWYVTEDQTYELEPLLVYYTDANDTTVRQFSFSSQSDFQSYLNGLLGKAVTKTADAEQIVGGTSKVLTMSTCNYIDGYGRTILVCVQKSEANAVLNPTS
jgi:sortase B